MAIAVSPLGFLICHLAMHGEVNSPDDSTATVSCRLDVLHDALEQNPAVTILNSELSPEFDGDGEVTLRYQDQDFKLTAISDFETLVETI